MNQHLLKACLLGAVLCGPVATAWADDPVQSRPVPVSGSMGLLGQTYASLTYTHFNLNDSPANADDLSFQINQSLGAGLDGLLTYEWNQAGVVAGSRRNQQTFGGALRAFSTGLPWGRPYAEAGVGYAWTKFEGTHDNSFVWEIATGVEFQAAPAVSVTPYVEYQDARDLAGGGTWNFGVKANYWIDSQWAVTVGLNRDDQHNTGFTVGTNFRF